MKNIKKRFLFGMMAAMMTIGTFSAVKYVNAAERRANISVANELSAEYIKKHSTTTIIAKTEKDIQLAKKNELLYQMYPKVSIPNPLETITRPRETEVTFLPITWINPLTDPVPGKAVIEKMGAAKKYMY